MKSRLLGAVCASFVAIVSPSTYATSYQYTSTQIPSLGGGTTWVRGVNDARQVVGTSTISGGEFRAFIYDNGAMTNLGTFGGNSSAANAINNNGYVTGYATTTIPGTGFYSNPDHAFFYNGTDMIDIGTLSLDETNSKGNAINDNNQIAGVSDVILSGSPGGGFAVGRRGFIYDDGVMTDINFGNSSVIYNGINDKGEIVGHNLNTPLYYYNGVTTDLTSVIGGEAQLKDINNSGMIVGVSEGVGFFLQDDIFTPLGATQK